MKICYNCNNQVDDNAAFCNHCGAQFAVPESQPAAPVNQVQYADNQQPVYQQPNYQQWQQPVPTQPPKKKKTGMIVAIVAAVLIVLAIIGSVAEKAFQNQGYGNGDTDTEVSTPTDTSSYSEPAVKPSYTKGTFDGKVYENEWADMKLVLPSGFSNASETDYSSYENDVTDCGAYFWADDTLSAITVCFEKLPTLSNYSESEYMDLLMNGLKAQAALVNYNVADVYDNITIANASYTKAVCSFTNDYGSFYHTFYVRKLDGYMISINVIGLSPEANDSLAKTISRAN